MVLQRHQARRQVTKLSNTILSRPSSRRSYFHNHHIYSTISATTTTATATATATATIPGAYNTCNGTRSFSLKSSPSSFSTTDTTIWKAWSTRIEDILSNPMWLIPRKGTGFDNFLKKDKKNVDKDEDKNSNVDEGKISEDGNSGSEDAPKKDNDDDDSKTKKSDDEGVFGSFRSQYSNNNTRNNSEGGNGGNDAPPNFSAPTSLIAALMLMGFTYMMIRNDDDSSVAPSDFSREITWNDFCNYLLETGQVEKIVVTNNHTIAKVFLKPGSQGLPQHQNRQYRYSDRRQQQHESNSNPMFDDSTQIQDGFSSGSNDEFSMSNQLNNNGTSQPNQPQIVYRFAIGSVDSFEKKLEEAQKVVGIDPYHEIPVQYTNETTTRSEILSVLPSLFLMGAALYFMRFAAGSMGGSAGGGGGMGGKIYFLFFTGLDRIYTGHSNLYLFLYS
jgi:hypothetical protein